MLVGGHVVRVDVMSAYVRTSGHVTVGAPRSSQDGVSGRVKCSPQVHRGALPDRRSAERRRIVFETDGKVVTRYRIGARPSRLDRGLS